MNNKIWFEGVGDDEVLGFEKMKSRKTKADKRSERDIARNAKRVEREAFAKDW